MWVLHFRNIFLHLFIAAFPKGSKDLVLSAGLWTLNVDGVDQVIGLIVLLLPWVVGRGYGFYVVKF